MPSALLDRIDHHQLLGALGVDTIRTLPAVSKCPLCQEPASLEITRGLSGRAVYRCRNRVCDFLGDGVALFQEACGISDTYSACLQLLSEGVLEHTEDFHQHLESYLARWSAFRNVDLAFWQRCQQNLSARSTFAAAILQRIGAYGEGIWEQGLHHHVGTCNGRWIKDYYEPRRGSRTWIKMEEEYLVIPLWGDMLTIVGYLLINQWLDTDLLPVHGHHTNEMGLGFLHTCYPNDDLMVVCTDPFQALGVFSRGLAAGDRVGLVYAHPSSTTFRTCPARQHLLLNLEDRIQYHKMGLRIDDCLMATPQTVEAAAIQGHEPVRAEIDLLHDQALTPYQAISQRLARSETFEALSDIDYLNLSSSDSIKVIGASRPEDKDRVSHLLKGRMQNRSIGVGNVSISCTPDGWRTDKGLVVCDTMFFIDRLLVDQKTQQATAEGTITQGDNQIPFSAPLEEVTRRTEKWLIDTVLKSRGDFPLIASGWKSRLFGISLAFRKPRTVHTATSSGWMRGNSCLLLPNILIEDGSILPNDDSQVDDQAGAMLSVPRDLSDSHLKDLCYDDESGGVFWGLFAALVSNILSPFHGLGTAGIALVGPQAGVLDQLIDQMDREVGFDRLSFHTASKRQAKEARKVEARSPLPVLVSDAWNNSEGFRAWLQSTEARNCLVEMSKDVAIATSLAGGWYYVSSQAQGDGWRRFETLWRALPLFIAWTQTHALDWPTSRSDLASKMLLAIERWLGDLGYDGRAVLNRAERIFTVDVIDRHTVWGVRFINFVIEAVESGLLRLRDGDGRVEEAVTIDARGQVVFVPAQLVGNLMRDMGITPPTHKQVCQSLQEIKALSGKAYQNVSGYAIDRDQYNMYWSLRSLPTT